MSLILSIIFVICIILVIIKNTIKYTNIVVREDFGHILLPLFKINLI